MRFTNKLYAQHLGWMFKKKWEVQRKRVPTGAESELANHGIKVKDIMEVANPKTQRQRVEFECLVPSKQAESESHPNWHQQLCHLYGNGNVLLEGISQAQVLIKTVEIKELPKNVRDAIEKSQLPSYIDRSVYNATMSSHVLDAEQMKLPKVKIPERPAFRLPRDYGISHQRKNRLLINRLLAECEKLAGHSLTSRRRLLDLVNFKVTLPKDNLLLQFDVTAEKFITAARPIEPIKGKYDDDLPDLYPMKCTISMPKKHVYTTETFYPLSNRISCTHPHTVVTHFDKDFVGNVYETGVTTTQFHSRTLLKAFAVAATRAKQLYSGSALEKLPKPIVVQSIQTDGRVFHFGVFQLNTLSLEEKNVEKNYWFHESNMDLFTECGYRMGRPYLEGFNKDVFRVINAFYHTA